MTTNPEVDDLVRRLLGAWNERDERAFAGAFTPAAEYVTGEGERVHGRDAIAGLVRHADAGLHVSMVGELSAACDANRGTARFSWAAVPPGGSPRRGKITCVVARHESRWLIEALRNDEEKPTESGSHRCPP